MNTKSIPVLLPHYRIQRGVLSTLKGRKIEITREGLNFLEKCDGNRSIENLVEIEKIEKEERYQYLQYIHSLEEKRIITLLPSIKKLGYQSKKILVLSPHIDDAALSVGGLMKTYRESNLDFTVLNIFSKQSFQTGLRVPQEQLEMIAIQEDQLAGKHLNYQSLFLGLKGIQERHPLDLNEIMGFNPQRIYKTEIYHLELMDLMEKIQLQIHQIAPELIWAPLGLGGHLDHLLVGLAVFELIQRKLISQEKVLYYEDLPYAACFPLLKGDQEQPKIYKLQQKKFHDITEAMQQKMKALMVYCTRLRLPQIQICHDYSQSVEDSTHFGENLWSYCNVDL